MRRIRVVVMLGLLLSLAACNTAPTVERQFIKFNIIERSQVSGFTFQKLLHIRSAEDFRNLWIIHSQPTRAAMPKIDFDSDMVLAVFYGQTQTGGYDIYIHDIEETESELIVNVRTVEPPPGGMRIMMISQPNMIVSLPKSDKAIRFVHDTTI